MSRQQGSWDRNPIVRGMLHKPYLTKPEILGIFGEEDVLVAEVDGMLREYDGYLEALEAAPSKETDDADPNPRHAPHVQRREGVFRFVDHVRAQLLEEVAGQTTQRIEAVNPAEYRGELTRILKGPSADAFLDARRPFASAHDLLFQAAYGSIRYIARSAARQVRRYPRAEFCDLLHEGVLGGVHAGKRYNQFSGASYLGYAADWIWQFMQKFVFDTSRVIRIPGYRWRQLTPILRESNRLWHETGSVSLDALAERTHLSPETIQGCVEAFSMHASLQGGFTEEDDRTLEGVVASDALSPQDNALDRLLAERLREEVSRLPDRERRVLTRYFGLDGQPSETLQQIGTRFGCTKENIRQIKEKALGRLRLQLPLTGEDVPY